ncbi:ankyrin repeat and zinc finger domain-containing protein 1 [Dendrobium catenatum]|uniref:ATP-dependent DNA helicase HFM1/MER3 n=1 Tax=Dendrobium catenatum TaxID=906689 RepID=A0A2I0XGG3_9ASPA|nr:ankyrin repeat and zinc finger domain-containing protein 1 [Dendrobium catenatum]PKU87001.1 ATP-dependent DNA helicase HFM1/MER3 [Dendrobium catenatum]
MAATEKSQREQKIRSLFDLPSDFFDSCRLLLFDHPFITPTDEASSSHRPTSSAAVASADSVAVGEESHLKGAEEKVNGATQRWTCNTCKSEFESLQDQRSHFKSDFHRLNIKLIVAGKNIVNEEELDQHGCDSSFEDFDVSSISGSEDDFEKSAITLVKSREGVKQRLYIRLHSGKIVSVWRNLILDESEDFSLDDYKMDQMRNDGSALILGEDELTNRLKNLLSEPRDKSHLRIVLLLSGGHFAGCVFDGNSIIAHKTFHRYVVRAKAGKKQSTKDAAGKAAHSAGSSLRRHNEAALKKEIQDLLLTWKPYINSSLVIFVYAPSRNRQILFDVEKQHWRFHDHVTRQIPLTVRRPTLKEAKRIYLCLTQLSYEEVDEDSQLEEPNLHTGDEVKKNQPFHESRVIEHLELKMSSTVLGSPVDSAEEHIPNDFANISLSHCENRSTSLHVAARTGNAQWTLELLEQGCSPCLKDERGRTPYMLATEKEVRNTFRRFMAANLDRWDWQAAYVPSPLTIEMEEAQAAKQAEKHAKRKAKAKESKKLRKEKEKAKEQEASLCVQPSKQKPPSDVRKQILEKGTTRVAPSRQLPTPNEVAISKEEEEKLALAAEREKRAAAAERRIAAMKNVGISSSDTRSLANDLLCSCCNASLSGKIPFHRYHYKYCSTSCMHVHREVLEEDG